MKLKIRIVLLALIVAIFSFGCKKENAVEEEVIEEVEVEIEEEIEEEEEEEVIVEEKIGLPSPISGIYAIEEKINRRPIAVMFDNHPKARWQAGLKDAEIVYEFLVEFPYTRYMGIYLINDPESLGPIRSARPCFVTTSLEYDAVYVHVGGSPQAKSDIRSLNLADIDGLSSGKDVFWRLAHKKAPNNMYSSMEILRKDMERRGYRTSGEYTPFKFREDEMDIIGDSAEKVIISYRKDNISQYNYDSEEKLYKRFKDGELHIDESDNTSIVAKNIIIQKASTRVVDNEGRLSIDLEGSGEGKYITNGKAIDIKWLKDSKRSKTLYYNVNNNEEIVLNPGITWIQIVENNTDLVIE